MRMQEAVYECPDDLHGYQANMKTGDDVYANVPPNRRPVRDTPDAQKSGLLKLAGVCLALLCVVLLTVIIGLSVRSASEAAALQHQICNLERTLKKYTVNITLDPDTAHPLLLLSPDLKQVRRTETKQNYTDNPKRFNNKNIVVLGAQSLLHGRHYYEVGVAGKVSWTLGVVRESFKRNALFTIPIDGLWIMWMRYNRGNKIYKAADIYLDVKHEPVRIGVFVDYNASSVSFYNAETWDEMFVYKDVDFREKLFPYFNPQANYEGQNDSPLIIQTPAKCQI